MKKLTRQETAKEVLRIISKLPSKELIANSYVRFGIEGLQPGDCRFCAQGAVLTYFGGITLTKRNGVFSEWCPSKPSNAFVSLNQKALSDIEDSLFKYERTQRHTREIGERHAELRRELYGVAVAKCKLIMAE